MAEITNQKDNSSSSKHVFLIFGKTGWIGGQLQTLLRNQGKTFYLAESRSYDRPAVIAEIEKYRPTHVLNACGVTGRPNVDWCEDNKMETVRTNVVGTLIIADVCALYNVHHTLFATGCIFEYDEAHTIGGTGFTESDKPNFHGSFYSHTKALCEDLLSIYPTTCILRVRMPISDDLNPRNFLTKIIKYDRVVDVPNSMTVLTDMLPSASSWRSATSRASTTSAIRAPSRTTSAWPCIASTWTRSTPGPTSQSRSRRRSSRRVGPTTPSRTRN
jgi:3,5-epimerase/4-reductase